MMEESIFDQKCRNCSGLIKENDRYHCKDKDEETSLDREGCNLFSIKPERLLDNHLEFLMKVLHSWLYFEDEEIIEIILSCAIAEEIEGDPLWIFLIAPPGACKTEILRALTDEKKFYHLSNLTPKTFVSGLMLGNGPGRRKIEDLLPQLNKKVLIFKDFTTILEKSREQRSEIISQLREIYDGQFSAKFGTIDKAIRYTSRFGLMAGVTPVIDKYWKVMQQLGERFLKIRWNEDMDKTTRKSRENEGKESVMRKEIIDVIDTFFDNLSIKNIPNFNDEKFGEQLSEIAKFVAIARTPVSIQDYRTDFYQDYVPSPERPTRLVKQFKKLAKCLAIIRKKKEVDEEEIKSILRVARDTIPQDRLAILDIIRVTHEGLYGCPRSVIFRNVKIPESSIRKILEQLKILDLVEEKLVKEETYQETKYYYSLKPFVNKVLYPLTLTALHSKSHPSENMEAE